MRAILSTEKIVVEGTFGDKKVCINRCLPGVPNGTQVILLHGAHSTANLNQNNKFQFLAELLAEQGYTPWLVETSRLVRNRQIYGENASNWITDAFGNKTFSQEQEDVFRAIRYIINSSEKTEIWLWGFSLGGSMALFAVTGEISYVNGDPFKPELIVLSGTGLTPYPEIGESMMKQSILSTLDKTGLPELLTRIQAGAIISFRGEDDEIFSEKSCTDLLNKIPLLPKQKAFHTIKGADHSLRVRYGKKDPGIMSEMMELSIAFNNELSEK